MLHYIDTQPLVTQAWPTGFGRLRTQTRTQMTKVYRLNHYTIKIQKVTQTIDIEYKSYSISMLKHGIIS